MITFPVQWRYSILEWDTPRWVTITPSSLQFQAFSVYCRETCRGCQMRRATIENALKERGCEFERVEEGREVLIPLQLPTFPHEDALDEWVAQYLSGLLGSRVFTQDGFLVGEAV